MAPLAPVPRARRPPPDVPVYDVNDSRPASAAPSEHFADPPDVTISTGVGMRGELSFPKLLRLDIQTALLGLRFIRFRFESIPEGLLLGMSLLGFLLAEVLLLPLEHQIFVRRLTT